MALVTRDERLEFLMQSVSLALIYYDYLISLDREIKYIWQRDFHPMSIAFLFCRYSLIANVTFMIGLFNKWHHTRVCDELYIFSAVLSVAGRIGVMAILGGRTCAVWRNNRWVIATLIPMAAAVVCAAMLHVPRVSCTGEKVAQIRTYTDILAILTVAYEVLASSLLMIGCARDFNSLKEMRKDGLVMLLVKEGMLFSGFVTLLTATGLWFNYVAEVGSFGQRFLNALIVPISGIMCARFLLHVREWHDWEQSARIVNALPTILATASGSGSRHTRNESRSTMGSQSVGTDAEAETGSVNASINGTMSLRSTQSNGRSNKIDIPDRRGGAGGHYRGAGNTSPISPGSWAGPVSRRDIGQGSSDTSSVEISRSTIPGASTAESHRRERMTLRNSSEEWRKDVSVDEGRSREERRDAGEMV